MSDGADAVKFGLSQRATNSREEWAKRARNLEANQNYQMAAKAFIQASDPVRAAVAEARQRRHDAAEASVAGPQRRRLLSNAAMQLLAAALRPGESPDPVDPKQLRKWALLASKCLSEAGGHHARAAAELYIRLRKFRLAAQLFSQLKDKRAEADCCMSAWRSLSTAAAFGSDDALEPSAGPTTGPPLAEPKAKVAELAATLGGGAVDEDRRQRVARDNARKRTWLVKAATLYHEVADYVASLSSLRLLGGVEDVLLSTRNWADFGKAVQKMAREAHVRTEGEWKIIETADVSPLSVSISSLSPPAVPICSPRVARTSPSSQSTWSPASRTGSSSSPSSGSGRWVDRGTIPASPPHLAVSAPLEPSPAFDTPHAGGCGAEASDRSHRRRPPSLPARAAGGGPRGVDTQHRAQAAGRCCSRLGPYAAFLFPSLSSNARPGLEPAPDDAAGPVVSGRGVGRPSEDHPRGLEDLP